MRLALATSLATLRRCVAMSAAPKAKVVVLAGPTAVGKSAAALELCRSLGGEIVSADSVQLYRGLDIGANKPSAADMAAVRHHLVDAGDPAAPWSAGEWCRAAAARADYLVGRRDDAGDGALDAGARRDAYVDFCRKFRTASRNYAAEQMKWYRRDADFAVVPAGDGAALAALFAGDRADYEARRAGDGAARDSSPRTRRS
ncbi:hypothetical protein JL721_6463 [Aureococcus anophagefferens]|nr:hypothetical protein JL721_6463 [Aureococcus anophagefferens]